uniref:Uncharacterized protein n=1 Tax=Stomoxys calcitrans TaxID=35570 RepID=A0A1I8Q428_STOCA
MESHQQQSESLIQEMLTFLDDTVKEDKVFSNNEKKSDAYENNGERSVDTINKEKLQEKYPIWNTREIVSKMRSQSPLNNENVSSIWGSFPENVTHSTVENKNQAQSPKVRQYANGWHKDQLGTKTTTAVNGFKNMYQSQDCKAQKYVSDSCTNKTLNNMADIDPNAVGEAQQLGTDSQEKAEKSMHRDYLQEVHKAIYGDANTHPGHGSSEYYQAAQNYAIYGKEFLDFPQDLQAILGMKVSSPIGLVQNGNSYQCPALYANTLTGLEYYGQPLLATTPMATMPTSYQQPSFATTCNASTPTSSQQPLIATTPVGTLPPTSAIPLTPAYYQCYNAMTVFPTRSVMGNIANTPGIIAGNFIINNAPSQPMIYNQPNLIIAGNNAALYTNHAPCSPVVLSSPNSHNTTNFISNSLANASLTSSRAALYQSNTMLKTTGQCYTNGNCGIASNRVQLDAAAYERAVYMQAVLQYNQQWRQALLDTGLCNRQEVQVASSVTSQKANEMK